MMMKRKYRFFGNNVSFTGHWKKISAKQIEAEVPECFPGKEDFIKFYSAHNGGNFLDYSDFEPNPKFPLPKEFQDKDRWDVLGFDPISLPNEEGPSVSTYSFLTMETIKTYSPTIQNQRDKFYQESASESKDFFSTHIPIATDSANSIYLISVSTGEVKYLDFDDYFEKPNLAFTVASSFLDFCNRIRKSSMLGM